MSKTSEKITNWLIEQAKKQNAKGFVVDYTEPSVASALAIKCASRTMRGCTVIATKTSQKLILDQVDVVESQAPGVESTLLSAKVANDLKSLIIQPFDIIEMELIRPWPARYCLVADVLPFSNMYRKNINAEFAALENMESFVVEKLFEKESREYYSDELKISFDELEWVHKLEKNPRFNGIISGPSDPTTHRMWSMLTIRQKHIVSTIYNRYRVTNNRLKRPEQFR